VKRAGKKHALRWTRCDGCGGVVDMDGELRWFPRETKRGTLRIFVVHDRDVCEERTQARTSPLSEETRARLEFRRFMREHPRIAIAVLTLNMLEAP
jgi:hypothetical protein